LDDTEGKEEVFYIYALCVAILKNQFLRYVVFVAFREMKSLNIKRDDYLDLHENAFSIGRSFYAF